MKKIFNLLFVTALAAVSLSSCDEDDDPIKGKVDADSVVTVSGLITKDTLWTADKKWILSGKVAIGEGAVLTIDPGTIIMGQEGTEANASALIIARGGKIMANGTADKPIIFTSIADNIKIGEQSGTNLTEKDAGLWGGLLVLGKAKISDDAPEKQIEGIPADDKFGLYGGDDDDDDSGVIKYVSIRHGGALLGEGNEINGLTLGGVGSKTKIDYVEVVANADDGIEFFGGTVNVSHALVWAQEDDAYDVDQAYSGTVDNYVYVSGSNSDHALEIDGPEGDLLGSFIMQNGSLKGSTDAAKGELADFRSKAQGTVKDSYFFGFKDDADIELDAGEFDEDKQELKRETKVSENFDNGSLIISGLEFDKDYALSVKIGSDIKNKAGIVQHQASAEDKALATKLEAKLVADNPGKVAEPNVGADMTKFTWTYASAKGALADFK